MATAELRSDPLAIINMTDLARRMGYTERTIRRWLADDVRDGTPGRRFPVPMANQNGRVEWRERTIVLWLEKRERAA